MSEIFVSEKKDVLNSNTVTFDERLQCLNKQNQKEEESLKKEKKSPFKNFYQFNREHTKDMIILASKYPKAHAIMLFLLDQMDNYNAVVCSYQVIQEALGLSQATVARSIKALKETNFITIYKSGTANVYAVNRNLAWSSWGTNYRYAKFDAKIIISEAEQKEQSKIKAIKHKEITINDETLKIL
jgi:DNA-binding transcriptional ArsR family regulator